MDEITRLESVQDAAAAATRLAELEVIDSTTGLNPEQQAEREVLAQRAEAQAAREAELEAIGAPAESQENPSPALDQQAQDASNSGAVAVAAAPAFNPATVQAKTFPQFQLERGFKPSEMRRGTPEWDALLAEWAAVKTARAGTNPAGGTSEMSRGVSRRTGPVRCSSVHVRRHGQLQIRARPSRVQD